MQVTTWPTLAGVAAYDRILSPTETDPQDWPEEVYRKLASEAQPNPGGSYKCTDCPKGLINNAGRCGSCHATQRPFRLAKAQIDASTKENLLNGMRPLTIVNLMSEMHKKHYVAFT
jgi:hypothetical protein